MVDIENGIKLGFLEKRHEKLQRSLMQIDLDLTNYIATSESNINNLKDLKKRAEDEILKLRVDIKRLQSAKEEGVLQQKMSDYK